MTSQPATRKLFFALWPDEGTRRRLYDATRAFSGGGLVMPAANLHLTLVFVGHVDAATQRCMETAAAQLRQAPFELVLDCIDSFGRKILWAGSRQPPDALFELQRSLDEVLAEGCGHRPEQRPYRPHVTLQRKLCRPVRDRLPEAVIWRVDRFSLIESVAMNRPATPPRYHPLRHWPLRA